MSNLWNQLNDEMSTVIRSVVPGVVRIHAGHGIFGAGTIWHRDGLIVTNAHVVRRRDVKVDLGDGRSFSGRLLARDTDLDLAALAVDATDLPTLQLGRSQHLQPGQWVLALGHPWGVADAATTGVVIGIGPHPEGILPQREFVQVDLSLRPGHSGGPLVDAHSRLVGINTMMNGPEVGLAVPAHEAKRFLRQKLGT